jgi:hypothetical protein
MRVPQRKRHGQRKRRRIADACNVPDRKDEPYPAGRREWYVAAQQRSSWMRASPPNACKGSRGRHREGLAVQPRRWVAERFFAWIGRNRRLAKDFEATIASARAFLYAASVMLLVRRLVR